MNSSQKKAIDLANKAINECRAYNSFLIDNKCNMKKIKDWDDFLKLPLMNKRNYLEKYKIEDRLFNEKEISDFYMVCTSSGSTGEPTLWPRDYEIDSKIVEMNTKMYQDLFDIKNKKTLVVVTFGMGAWTAGMFTAKLCWNSSVGHKLSVVTPGLDKEIALRIIKKLSPYYDQTVITGYPPFIIDLLEYGAKHKFDFKEVNTKIHYTSARVSEKLRNEMVRRVSKNGDKKDVLGFYACSETGIIGIETPFLTDVLEESYQKKNLCKDLFGDPDPPTLISYNPMVKYIEEVDEHIVLTVDQVIPLIRFDMNDRGGLITGEEIISKGKEYGVKFSNSLKNQNLMYMHGRADAVRLLNNIYVDDIQYCLEKSKFCNRFTGNFKYGLDNVGLKNRLKILIYLKEGKEISSEEKEFFTDEIYENLLKVNPDFKMIQKGVKATRFKINFLPEDKFKYKAGKFKHFL